MPAGRLHANRKHVPAGGDPCHVDRSAVVRRIDIHCIARSARADRHALRRDDGISLSVLDVYRDLLARPTRRAPQ